MQNNSVKLAYSDKEKLDVLASDTVKIEEVHLIVQERDEIHGIQR